MAITYFKKHQDIFVALYAALITFLTYATVYAFRKPFSAGTYYDMPAIFLDWPIKMHWLLVRYWAICLASFMALNLLLN